MGDRSSGAVLAAGVCLSLALLRMFAPAMPFDWMTFGLVALAAAALTVCSALPGGQGRGQSSAGAAARREPSEPDAVVLLRMRMAEADWPVREGGLYDALSTLHKDKPFAALCAARGALAMLTRQKAMYGEEAETLSLLENALDGLAARGENSADPGTIDALFSYTLRAIGRLEAVV